MALFVAKVSDDFVRKLAHEFLEPYMTMAKLAKKYKSSAGTISNILYKGVALGILDDATAEAVVRKVVSLADDLHQTKNRWDRAKKERKINEVKPELEYLERQLEEAKFHYESFDDYAVDDSSPSKEEIAWRVTHLENEIACARNYIKSLERQ